MYQIKLHKTYFTENDILQIILGVIVRFAEQVQEKRRGVDFANLICIYKLLFSAKNAENPCLELK